MEQRGVVEELGREECMALMATEHLGRLGVVVDGTPLVLPMQFALDGETVVLQTNQGAKALHSPLTTVTFEVDHVDWEEGVGWSVLIQGLGEDISTAIDERSEARRALAVHSWALPPRRSLAHDHPPNDHRSENPDRLNRVEAGSGSYLSVLPNSASGWVMMGT